jgi:hypothetical protein
VFETVVRGVPLWLLQEYVEQIGGRVDTEEWLSGDGWRARLTQVEDFEVGSLRVGQVKLEIQGDADSVAQAWAALQPKLMRGGG